MNSYKLVEKFGSEKIWVNWRYEMKDGKMTKVPYTVEGTRASSTDPYTWAGFDRASSASENIGIVFPDDQHILGVDVDHCLENDELVHEQKDRILEFIDKSNTYAEFSPSGTGIHFYFHLLEPLKLIANKKEPYEVYNAKRFFTVTGRHYYQEKDVRDISAKEMLALLEIIGYPWGRDEKPVVIPQMVATLEDQEIIKKMFAAKNGSNIQNLYNGDISAYDGDDSRADIALCSHLAFWTGRNYSQIERIWLMSPLGTRNKTQGRKDYRERTINAAIKNCSEIYSNGSQKRGKNIKADIKKDEVPAKRVAVCPQPSREVSFDDWCSTISDNFPDLLFASEISVSIICQFLVKDISNPFALVLVDVPSAGKTIAINFFSDIMELTYATDRFTPASFVSNAANVKKEQLKEIDLLPRLQYKMFLIRDLATLFSKRDDDLNDCLGILTRVLDGEGLNTDSGTHGQRQYSGEYLFMILAASTPIPHKIWKMMGNLGSRLFFLKINSRDKSESELAEQLGKTAYKEKEKICRHITKDFLYGLWNRYPDGIEWGKQNDSIDVKKIIARCAKLLARLRGVVNLWREDSFDPSYKYETPTIEKPDRINQLLYNLCRGHAVALGRNMITPEDLRLVIELCIHSAPTARANLFEKLLEHNGKMTVSEIEKNLRCSKPTALREMKTLQILKICTLNREGNDDSEITLVDDLSWFISDEFNELRKK